jgi:rod shape-determining protein MreD
MRWLSYFILAYFALGVQVGLRDFIHVREASPNFLLLVVVFLAMNAPREPALLGCFFLGLMQDLLTLHPLGTWAVSYALVAMFVLSVQEVVYPEHPLTHFSLALLGGILCGVVLTVHGVLYAVLHKEPRQAMGLLPFADALYTAVLAPVVLGVLQRMKTVFSFRRVRKAM